MPVTRGLRERAARAAPDVDMSGRRSRSLRRSRLSSASRRGQPSPSQPSPTGRTNFLIQETAAPARPGGGIGAPRNRWGHGWSRDGDRRKRRRWRSGRHRRRRGCLRRRGQREGERRDRNGRKPDLTERLRREHAGHAAGKRQRGRCECRSQSLGHSSKRCNEERNLAVTRYCGLPGRVAQRESARFTRGRSLVRSQSRPSRRLRHEALRLFVCNVPPIGRSTSLDRPYRRAAAGAGGRHRRYPRSEQSWSPRSPPPGRLVPSSSLWTPISLQGPALRCRIIPGLLRSELNLANPRGIGESRSRQRFRS